MGKKDPNKGGVYADCWHIPGGGIDDGEDMKSALIREILEETGLNVSNPVLVDDEGKGDSEKTLKDTGEKVLCHMVFNVFKVMLEQTASEVKLVPTDDLVELRWFDREELEGAKLTPPSVELFERLKLF